MPTWRQIRSVWASWTTLKAKAEIPEQVAKSNANEMAMLLGLAFHAQTSMTCLRP
jgi:hypothetical protein